MTARVAQIWRHPIKAIGRDALSRASLIRDKWLPGDRLWAVTHERAKPVDGWMHKSNFLRGVTEPRLMAVTCRYDDVAGTLDLEHPDLAPLTIVPDSPETSSELIAWLDPLWSADLPRPTALVRQNGVHMTDVPEPWISINSTATLSAVSDRVGEPVSPHRWRGNLWIDGLAPWSEFDWIGTTVRIGEAELRVEARITRCKATMANPATGARDIDTLGALRTWGHQDFGVYARVIGSGDVAIGDAVVFKAAP